MGALERNWVRIKDSAAWRSRASSGPVQRILNSRSFEGADSTRRFLVSRLHSLRRRDQYRDLQSLCLVIGHTKSGGSLIGAMLDAHANISMADELDALQLVERGFDIHQIAYLIEKASRREAMKGRVTARRLDPYSFAVPGEAQGGSTDLRVIGDTKAGIATQRLGGEPGLLDRVLSVASPLDVRFIQVVRNPFDPIAAMRIRGKRTFEGAVERYFENCRSLDEIHRRLPQDALRVVRYESVTANPAEVLSELCTFLDVGSPQRFLDACASVIGQGRRERSMVDWTDAQIEMIMRGINRHEFLDGYSFDVSGSER